MSGYKVSLSRMIQKGLCNQIYGDSKRDRHVYCGNRECSSCFLYDKKQPTIKELQEFCVEQNIEVEM